MCVHASQHKAIAPISFVIALTAKKIQIYSRTVVAVPWWLRGRSFEVKMMRTARGARSSETLAHSCRQAIAMQCDCDDDNDNPNKASQESFGPDITDVNFRSMKFHKTCMIYFFRVATGFKRPDRKQI